MSRDSDSVSAIPASGRIGPNAVIRLAEALDGFESQAVTSRIFRACGVETYLAHSPIGMVPEEDVTSLHLEIHRAFGDNRARSIAWVAGRRTADYLLANRIPVAAQRFLRMMPDGLASRVLARSIMKNAWTFAGTGHVSAAHKPGTAIISITRCPICRNSHSLEPYCDFYAAVFEHLFSELVNAHSTVREISCVAMGDSTCVFEINLTKGQSF